MSFPSPSVVPPTFTQYPSVYFQGITFGGNGTFQLNTIEGLDMPTVRTGDPDAPREHGQYIGTDLLSGRDITLNIDVGLPFGSYSSLSGAMSALRLALTPTGTTENPLFIQLPNGTQLVSMVRPRKRSTKIDIPYINGNIAMGISIQFHATDPVLYAAGTLDPTVGIPAPLGGFSFPLIFPLSFGGGFEVPVIQATNYGDMPCYPILAVTGPCTYPTITNASLSGTPFIQFQVTMNAGDQLVINTDPKYPSATYYSSGSNLGYPVMYTLSQNSAFWALATGLNNIEFTTGDLAATVGTLTMEYSSAYSAAQ